LRTHRLSRILTDQRGIALPMALMIILILSALMAAFSVLGASEPTLAANQQRVAQARAMAESGLDRAIWALNNPGDASGIPGDNNGILPNPAGPAAAPYDGSVFIPVSLAGTQLGGFRVTVTASLDPVSGAVIPNERKILVDGWVPSDTAASRVKQRIRVTVIKLRNFGGDAPSALTVRGELKVGGHALVDSRSDTSCGNKAGSWSEGATTQQGSSKVYGYADNTPNTQVVYNPDSPATWGGDIVTQVPDQVFNRFMYTNDELNMLKAIARQRGTYYQTPAGQTVLFNASNQMPNGLIFVDTVSGNNITPSTPLSDFASLKISGNAAAHVDPATGDHIFQGLIIVNGSASIDGVFQMHGLVYLVNDLTYQGIGTGRITGAVISQNIRDASSISVDTDTEGNSTIIYNCAYAKNGDNQAPIPLSFTIKGGTYKEVAG
jgi:hypothetical protein